MKLMLVNVRGVDVVVIEGALDKDSAREAKKFFYELLDQGKRYIVLDLSKVELIDHSGLSILLGFFKRLNRLEGEVRLVGLGTSILKIFELTRLDRVLPICASLEEAIG